MEKSQAPLPVVIMKEDDWFIASCPLLDIATQGKTAEEVKENMQDLIEEYFEDPDTQKPELKTMMAVSVSFLPIEIPQKYSNETPSST